MENITDRFKKVFVPFKGLICYRSLSDDSIYVEAYDTGENNRLINPHPLSLNESQALAETLQTSSELQQNFLQSKGLLPDNVLQINASKNGHVLWYTKSQKVPLFFTDTLTIPNGMAHIPALVWKATKSQLCVYAVANDEKPTIETPLYYAPFFNIYKNGNVCMGTVDIDIDSKCRLEDFMCQWQSYFFNSKFSHLLDNYTPTQNNIVQLWQQQVNSEKPFPSEALKINNKTLENILK